MQIQCPPDPTAAERFSVFGFRFSRNGLRPLLYTLNFKLYVVGQYVRYTIFGAKIAEK